jgi:epoxide hydrolase
MGAIEPFRLRVADAELEDLRARLRATRWPEAQTGPGQGVPLAEAQALCAHWADGHDWRATEARLAAAGQYRTTIDGLGIHFLHARSEQPDALPLVLTHGWPGAVVEYLHALPHLTRAGFHCVVPSLPGYGWSDKPAAPGWGVERIARAWAVLMARLGYGRYGAQGTDWGTSVSAALATADPEHVVGVHLMPPLAPPDPAEPAPPGERDDDGDGYSLLQRTRPQTLAYALTDSPAGHATWIAEKLLAWSDPRTRPSRDAILDVVSCHWFPRTAGSSARLYRESLGDVARWIDGPLEPRDVVRAPVGCTIFPYELQRPSRRSAQRRFPDIRHWSEPDRGGHFPALEVPELFAAEVARCFAALR